MAKKVLTAGPAPPVTNSKLECSHSGKINTTGVSKLTIGGSDKVLTKAKVLLGDTFLGCSNTGGSLSPCSSVTSVSAGEATKLTVNGEKVMLDDIAGETNSAPTPGTLNMTDAQQTKLTAI